MEDMERTQADAYLNASKQGILITIRRDGRPQSSNIAYSYADGVARISLTTSRAKVKNLQRDNRALLHVTRTDGWYEYVVADGEVELSPAASDPNDTTVNELVEMYEILAGQPHPDWDEFRQAMVDEGRLVAKLRVGHVYGHVNG